MIDCPMCNTPHEPNQYSPCCCRGCKQAMNRRERPKRMRPMRPAMRHEFEAEIARLHAVINDLTRQRTRDQTELIQTRMQLRLAREQR